ncbi:MAG: tryptophanase [Bacteroidetes bacterium GWF2_42_66]|nr:MAG: tryptophanase [Bacteroidetes bacterium GWA2_42_15]OFY02204.1 MAG: tryptophanase [Bacteroidetes bacterium GWE2_42_39]OFY43651.1 MAG: tryptophanase [Bacteroidetes bacterium GWF2_42_66]HBL75285.1 tryptophanase [Prolixibacteraceae bacterium]HCR90418.1 tryptophanase [Prolixibacteraceae bacterium]
MTKSCSTEIKFSNGQKIPVELHKVRMVQKLHLKPVEERLAAMEKGGYNTFQLNTKDIFLDMLTDSGTNAMSDNQISSMLRADDAYAGSQSFYRMEEAVREVFGKHWVLPVHQGRAAENIISQAFIKKGDVIPMNYHFTTTKAHMELNGGEVLEIFTDEALKIKSDVPFKGNIDIKKLEGVVEKYGKDNVAFIRMEASTNLIGGQPFSIQNMREVRKVADKYGIMFVLDASLIGENAYFIKKREEEFKNAEISEILLLMCSFADVVYFSSRKVSSTRGGGICTNSEELFMKMRDLVVLFEGFVTYGGMSVREIEAMAVGLYETTDETVISQSPSFIEYAVTELDKLGVPVVTPAGALGCHVDAMDFLPHVPQSEYPAGALAAALFIISGIRGMERGTISSVRDAEGNDVLADVELLRLAFPRRVFTLSQTMYVVDRVNWLYKNRELVGGLVFTDEPAVLRFFNGRLKPTSDWPTKLVAKFKADFGDSL